MSPLRSRGDGIAERLFLRKPCLFLCSLEKQPTEWTLGTTKAAAEAVQAYTNKLVVDLNATTKVNAVEAAALYLSLIHIFFNSDNNKKKKSKK